MSFIHALSSRTSPRKLCRFNAESSFTLASPIVPCKSFQSASIRDIFASMSFLTFEKHYNNFLIIFFFQIKKSLDKIFGKIFN